MQYVVNEWFLDYLVPDATEQNIKSVFKFIAFINNSFTDKFYRYMKQHGWNLDFKKRFKILKLLFYDSTQTYIIETDELSPLSSDIKKITPEDDVYLVQLAFSTEDKTIITTDTRLKEALKDIKELNIELLEDFLNKYCSEY